MLQRGKEGRKEKARKFPIRYSKTRGTFWHRRKGVVERVEEEEEGYLSCRSLVFPLLNNKLVGNNKRFGTLK